MKRANVLVAVGAVLVFVGIGLAFVVSNNGKDKKEPQVAVLVAKADIGPGESGDDLVAAGKVGIEQVDKSEVIPGVARSTADIQGKLVSSDVTEGSQLPTTVLRDAVVRGQSIPIPDGMQAVAVTVPFTAGIAGYAGPGDLVNVFVTIPPGSEGAAISPFTRLMLTNVLILDVSTEVAPRRAATATAEGESTPRATEVEQLTLLLALDAADAEKVIFAGSVNELSFSLIPEKQKDSDTPGITYGPRYVDDGVGQDSESDPNEETAAGEQ